MRTTAAIVAKASQPRGRVVLSTPSKLSGPLDGPEGFD